MVQTLVNEVRRLGTEQNNNLQEIQRLRAEHFLPTLQPRREPVHHHRQLLQGAESSTRELESHLCFQGDESTWSDWRFKLRSCVSVVDLQLGRMVEEAELAAHANTWMPSEPSEPRHGRTAQVPARHADKRTRTADHPTTVKCSAILLEGTIRVHKHVPWHSRRSSCIIDFWCKS